MDGHIILVLGGQKLEWMRIMSGMAILVRK